MSAPGALAVTGAVLLIATAVLATTVDTARTRAAESHDRCTPMPDGSSASLRRCGRHGRLMLATESACPGNTTATAEELARWRANRPWWRDLIAALAAGAPAAALALIAIARLG